LTTVKGIGSKYAEILQNAGIMTIADVTNMTPATIASAVKTSEGRAAMLIANAHKFLEEHQP
jgi:predicted flap endonuclease-1-like 5' DNA nuclease